MPALTTANITVPVICRENLVASLVTRVLGPKLQPVPFLTYMKMPGMMVAMPGTSHPLSPMRLVAKCREMGWKCQLSPLELMVSRAREGVVMIGAPISKSSGRTDLAPLADEGSYWKPIRTQETQSVSGYRYSTTLSKYHLPGLDHSLRRTSSRTTDTLSELLSEDQSQQGRPYTITSGPLIETRDTPLRQLVLEFLATEEMAWFTEIEGPIPFETWVKRYDQRRRVELRAALNRLEEGGYPMPGVAKVKNFVKFETTDKFVDPRNISPREDEFLAGVGPYIAAIEQAAKNAEFLVKGLCPRKRATRLEWLREYSDYISIDFERFDQTITPDVLRIFERYILTRPFRQHDSYIRLVQLSAKTAGVSRFGTRYQVEGTRCSGDAWTSVANGLLNRFLVWLCLRKLPSTSWKSAHEGDDGIIAL
ncbi:putative RNA-dependent RNA polymerase, partial [Linepithema humile C virus 1]